MQITGAKDIPVADEIHKATDRGAAILATSWLDDYLTAAIQTKLLDDKDTLNKLFKPSGPLGALGVKIDVGFLLKLYSKATRDDMVQLATIRNRFAHWSQTIDFGTKEIRKMCESLTLMDRFFSVSPDYKPKHRPFSKEVARQVFLEHCGMNATVLNWITTQRIQESHTIW